MSAWADEIVLYGNPVAELDRLRAALRLFRSLVKEGGIPRYTIQSGAALNTVIEETVDPVLRAL